MPSHKLLPVFRTCGHSKSSLLSATQVREAVTSYIKTNELVSAHDPRYVPGMFCSCANTHVYTVLRFYSSPLLLCFLGLLHDLMKVIVSFVYMYTCSHIVVQYTQKMQHSPGIFNKQSRVESHIFSATVILHDWSRVESRFLFT